MDPASCISLVAIILFIFMSGFYSSSETALGSISKYKYIVEAENGSRRAKLIVWLYEHYEMTLVSILVGNNVFNLAISTIGTTLALGWFNQYIEESLLSLLVSILLTVVVFIFGETLPKIAAKRNPDAFVRVIAYPLLILSIIFFPISIIFRGISWAVSKLFRGKDQNQITEEDFANTIEESAKSGVIDKNESDIIQASIEFADTSVREVLTPVKKLFMIDAKGLTKEKLHQTLKSTDYSRIPIYFGDPNHIIGVLIVKNYINAYLENHDVSLVSVLEKPYFVTPGIKVDTLLEGMRARRTQVALVKKDDVLLGMVTTEDVLEELVGSIAETDKMVEEKPKKKKQAKAGGSK